EQGGEGTLGHVRRHGGLGEHGRRRALGAGQESALPADGGEGDRHEEGPPEIGEQVGQQEDQRDQEQVVRDKLQEGEVLPPPARSAALREPARGDGRLRGNRRGEVVHIPAFGRQVQLVVALHRVRRRKHSTPFSGIRGKKRALPREDTLVDPGSRKPSCPPLSPSASRRSTSDPTRSASSPRSASGGPGSRSWRSTAPRSAWGTTPSGPGA